jgi:hypothetical protein
MAGGKWPASEGRWTEAKGGAPVRAGRKIMVTVAALGSLLLAVSGAVPALARGGPAAGLSRSTGHGAADLANATSTSFAGWVFKVKAATSVTAEFQVPSLKCGKLLSGVGPMALMVTGTAAAENLNSAGLLLACADGTAVATPVVRVDGTATIGTSKVATGDLIQSTVTTSASKTTATLADLTTGHTFTLTKSGKGAAALRELIIDNRLVSKKTGKPLHLANFGTISFSAGAVSGKALGSVTPRTAVNLLGTTKVVRILTGPLTGAAKNAFTTTWKPI